MLLWYRQGYAAVCYVIRWEKFRVAMNSRLRC